MRSLFIFLSCSIIAGCASYGDIHSHAHAMDSKTLATHHNYPISHATTLSGWWNKWHDPELNHLITVALQDSPSMQMAEARVHEAQHIADEAYSSLWPVVDLSGNIQRQRFSERGLAPPPFNGKTFNIGELGLNFNYEFDFWGKNRQLLQAKINASKAAKAEWQQSQLVISTAVAQTYFQLMNDLAELQIAKQELAINNKLLGIIQDRMQQGIVSDIPVQTIQSNLQTAQQAVDHYNQAIRLSRNTLAVLMGTNPFTTNISIPSHLPSYSFVALPSSLSANLLANRPDIQATQLRAASAANEVNVAKTRFFPNINLSLLFSYQSTELNKLFLAENQNNAIMGAIDLPIFDAGARRANLGVKYAEYDLAVNEYNQTILTALREVADQETSLQTVNAQLKAQTLSYNAIARNYQLYLLRYKHGIIDYTHILEIENTLLQEKASQLELKTKRIQTIVALLKALGGKDV